VRGLTKEQLEKIAWLNRAFYTNMKLKALKAYKISKTEDMDCGGMNYENDGCTDGKNENGVENKLLIYCDDISKINSQIEKQEQKLKSIEDEINHAIYSIGDDRLESVLICRHLAFMKAEVTAREIGYSPRNESRLYIKALDKLSCIGT